MTSAVHYSRKSDDHETPRDFFLELHREFRFQVDVCASARNAKLSRYFTKRIDGLKQDWRRFRCWCNPPYSRLREWLAKASEASKRGALVVCLIPSRTDTRAWHDHVWDERRQRPRRGVSVRFVRGRLRFGKAKDYAPFPSCVVVFKPRRTK